MPARDIERMNLRQELNQALAARGFQWKLLSMALADMRRARCTRAAFLRAVAGVWIAGALAAFGWIPTSR